MEFITFPRASLIVSWAVLAVSVSNIPTNAAVNVTQHHNHDSRDGLYIDPAFTYAAVTNLTRDTTFSGVISGNVYAQPLYIEGGPGGRAVVIAATEANTVFALNAADGTVAWQKNVGAPVPSGTLPCGNITPVGITGTPVVDLPSRALFFDSMILTNGSAKHFIFSLNVDTGAINSGWPVDVDATARSGSISFSSPAQGERGALAIMGGTLYAPYGGLFGDCGSYHGWVVGIPINNPSTVMAWSTTANGGGLWSVNGISGDGTNLYFATGNTSGASSWGGGEAVFRLPANLAFSNATPDYWVPTNWSNLDGGDTDVGSSGAIPVDVPGATPSKLVAAFGKDGNAYLLNRTNLGGITSPVKITNVSSGLIIQAPATYQTPSGTYVAITGAGGTLMALRINPTSPPSITKAWTGNVGSLNGSPFVTSSDGTNDVIVWSIGAAGDQRLHGYKGDNGAPVFSGGGSSELMSGTRKYNTGIAANGRIFIAGDNKVYAFRVPVPTMGPIVLNNMVMSPDGSVQFGFSNIPGTNFTVYSATDISVPFIEWVNIGATTEISPGQYQFIDTQATNNTQRFYRVSSP